MNKQKIRLYSKETLESDYILEDERTWKKTGKINTVKEYKIQVECVEKSIFGKEKFRYWKTKLSTDNKEEATKAFNWIKENNTTVRTEVLDTIEIN